MKTLYSDYVVIGSGIAGLFCAINASRHGRVDILTRGGLLDSSTSLAQGGIAAAVEPEDSIELHFQDTMRAGAGVCDAAAVRVLVQEGVTRLKEIAEMGVPFDTSGGGKFLVAREAAHSLARVVPAKGDGTGKAVATTLAKIASKSCEIFIHEQNRALEILTLGRRCVGVLAVDRNLEPLVYLARAVVLATGGVGRLFGCTTNSCFCNGEGLAMAYRAGAELADLEFIQFHPTALDLGEDPLPLISEAVRGHGARLVDQNGKRFMSQRHSWAELAPRDVVARAIFEEQTQGNSIFLDATNLAEEFARRFPNIFKACLSRGLDPRRDRLPVTPAAHFLMGGVQTDLSGATHVPGLYACGEVARTGAHGANRLASNSLLEGLVFGHRVAKAIAASPPVSGLPRKQYRLSEADVEFLLPPDRTLEECLPGPEHYGEDWALSLRAAMWENVGLVRQGEGLESTLELLSELESRAPAGAVEFINMSTVARLVVLAALAREESRGGHFRKDFPRSSPSLARHTFVFKRSETQNEPLVTRRNG